MESSTDGIEVEDAAGGAGGRGAVDWTETASSMAHVFVVTSSSLDNCYLQSECLHSGHRCVLPCSFFKTNCCSQLAGPLPHLLSNYRMELITLLSLSL